MKPLRRLLSKIQKRFPILSVSRMLTHNYRMFLSHRREWVKQGGAITGYKIILDDYADKAGSNSGHYFHQDLLVASFIFEKAPKRHVDVGSRVDGFVAHVASFRQIEVLDIRPLPPSAHRNIQFIQADLMNPANIEKSDFVSCLHAIEHFGLGRYTDPIDVNGHLAGIKNLVDLVKEGGTLYISFPIGKSDEVQYNAHRVFHPQSILKIPEIDKNMRLTRFDFVDDRGDLHLNQTVKSAVGRLKYGCGVYTFERVADPVHSL